MVGIIRQSRNTDMTNARNIESLTQIFRNLGMMVSQIAKRQSAAHGTMTKQELMTVSFLGHRGECRIGEIAEFLGIGQSAVTPIADRLEKAKLIQRIRSQKDRRVWIVRLTKKGSALFDKENSIYEEVSASMLAPLNSKEQNELIRLLSKMEFPGSS